MFLSLLHIYKCSAHSNCTRSELRFLLAAFSRSQIQTTTLHLALTAHTENIKVLIFEDGSSCRWLKRHFAAAPRTQYHIKKEGAGKIQDQRLHCKTW